MSSARLPAEAARILAVPLDIRLVKERLEADGGGYQVVHASPGLELGVYVLVAPEPDRQAPHEDDELYVVLDGHGVLEVEGKSIRLETGQAVYVPAGAQHGFTAYEQLSVLVVFARRWPIEESLGHARFPV